MNRLTIAALAFLFMSSVRAAVTDIYLSQSGGGSNFTINCATGSRPASFFNTAGNWPGIIGPGTTVHLCGTITSGLNFQGSGTSGSPITLDGTGAIMAQQIMV